MRNVIFIAFVGLYLCSCVSPAPIFTLTPAESETQWTCGVGFIDKTNQGISILAGFYENHNDLLCFDVTIKNESERNVLIDPKFFECIAQSSPEPNNSQRSSYRLLSQAINPEAQIQQLDAELSRENAHYQSSNTAEATILFLNLVVDITSFLKPMTKEQQDEHQRQEEIDRNRRNEQEYQHMQCVESLNQNKTYWQTQALRKTTLLPKQTVGGLVFFHHQENANFLKLRYPIGQACIEMCFAQKKIQP